MANGLYLKCTSFVYLLSNFHFLIDHFSYLVFPGWMDVTVAKEKNTVEPLGPLVTLKGRAG